MSITHIYGPIPDNLQELVKAVKDGKTLECRADGDDCNWFPKSTDLHGALHLYTGSHVYRVKPEPPKPAVQYVNYYGLVGGWGFAYDTEKQARDNSRNAVRVAVKFQEVIE